ncbi:hypothetical protein OA787_20810 [Citrobacter freundii]|nr:hypothetical protein [Citrobacter freundii]MDN4197183.1 hypothetical protein [Citrobacter freundii]MDN4227703.1 hypothetical protein [Citrobacter freundii]
MLTPIQESIIVLAAMKNTFEPVLKVFKRYINDDDLKFVLQMKMIVDLSSFSEEWARLGPLCKTCPDMILTLKICEPAVTRLRKWSGIRDFRNKALAHGFRDEVRDDNGRTIRPPTDLEKFYFDADVPNRYAEIVLLYEMAYFCMAVVMHRHGRVTDDLNLIYDKEIIYRGIDSANEFDSEMEGFMNHIEALDATFAPMWNGYRKLVDIIKGK